MKKEKQTRLVRHGDYLAEVEVELEYTDHEWTPYLRASQVEKLDLVHDALSKGDLHQAGKLATVFRLEPVDSTASGTDGA